MPLKAIHYTIYRGQGTPTWFPAKTYTIWDLCIMILCIMNRCTVIGLVAVARQDPHHRAYMILSIVLAIRRMVGPGKLLMVGVQEISLQGDNDCPPTCHCYMNHVTSKNGKFPVTSNFFRAGLALLYLHNFFSPKYPIFGQTTTKSTLKSANWWRQIWRDDDFGKGTRDLNPALAISRGGFPDRSMLYLILPC